MRIRRNPLRMMDLSLCAGTSAQLKAPPAEAAVLPPPSPVPAPPASAHVDIHTAQLVLPAAAPTEEVCLQSCAWTLHPHTLNPENLNDGLVGDAWREPRENPGLAFENLNIVFLLKRKKVEDNIGEQQQQQQEKVNKKLKRDGSSTQQKEDRSNKKMMEKVIKKEEEEEEEEEVNKKLKRDGISQQKKGCSNSNNKMMAKVIKEEEEEEEEEEVNKKLKRDGSSQQKKDCSNKKKTTKVIKEEVATTHKPSRCKRSDGRNWRCEFDAALPHTLCEKHLHNSRSSYNKRKEARSKSASQKASAISSEADPWNASSSSNRARTSAPPSSSFMSTGAAALASDAPESSKAAPPPPSPTGARPRSKRQRKNKGDDYSGGVFHYPEPFGPFRGKQRGNYSSPDHACGSFYCQRR